MPFSKLLTRLPIFTLFIAISVFAGWNIPAFYEWTDSDQSRPSPLLWQVPLAVAINSFIFCLALPWLPIAGDHANDTIRISAAGDAVIAPRLARVLSTVHRLKDSSSVLYLCFT